MSYTQARQLFRSCLRMCGLDYRMYSLHMLRRGAATAAARAGVDDQTIQRQGRRRSRLSLDYYIQDDSSSQLCISAAVGL